MEVSIHHPDHMLTMLSGFESLGENSYIENDDTRYTTEVLKINDCDFYQIEGNEGFLSAIRSAGVKIYEMIKNFIRGIKNFFFGSNGSKQTAAIKETESDIAKKAAAIKQEVKKQPSGGMLDDKMAKLGQEIAAARKDADRLLSTMSTGKGIYVKLNQMITTDGKFKIMDIVRLMELGAAAGIKTTSTSYSLVNLDHATKSLMDEIRQNGGESNTSDEPGGAIIKCTIYADKVAVKIGELAKVARQGLDELTKDLETANEHYNKHSNSDNTKNEEDARKVVLMLSRAGSLLSGLITECARALTNMDKGLNSIMASLELSSSESDNSKIQAAFAGADKFDE